MKRQVSYLRLLQFEDQAPWQRKEDLSDIRICATPHYGATSFVVVDTSVLNASIFSQLLKNLQPRVAIDFRPFPDFEWRGFCRSSAFACFKKAKIEYQDMAGVLGISSIRDIRLNPEIMASRLQQYFPSSKTIGPILLLSESGYVNAYAEIIPRLIKPSSNHTSWNVFIVNKDNVSQFSVL